jgi:hypothetical protein
MINALWLVLIIPIAIVFGFILCALLIENDNRKYVIK